MGKQMSYKERALVAEAELAARDAETVAGIVEEVAASHTIDMSNRREAAAIDADIAALDAWDKQFPVTKQKEQSNA